MFFKCANFKDILTFSTAYNAEAMIWFLLSRDGAKHRIFIPILNNFSWKFILPNLFSLDFGKKYLHTKKLLGELGIFSNEDILTIESFLMARHDTFAHYSIQSV